ncbi:T9SS type A sorting domain-containing protein [Crocinitomix catalasitica]|nr:T9SS type A sorting domain-containing protein [Crocinitomix catalasitica]
MKRLLLAILALTAVVNYSSAQLFDQMTPPDNTGFWSNENSVEFLGQIIQCADDFEVPAGPKWSVESITVRGFRSDDVAYTNHSMDSITIQLYDDNSGEPGTVFYADTIQIFPMLEPSATTTMNLNVLLPDSLGAGIYWLSVYGYGASNTSVWRWLGIVPTTPVNGNQAVLKDPLNVLGAGATDWTILTSIPGAPPPETLDLVFSINGFSGPHEMIGIDELKPIHLEIYPNPASHMVFVKSDSRVHQITVYDLKGREIKNYMLPGKQIDISELASGAYILQFLTDDGYAQEKLIVE